MIFLFAFVFQLGRRVGLQLQDFFFFPEQMCEVEPLQPSSGNKHYIIHSIDVHKSVNSNYPSVINI